MSFHPMYWIIFHVRVTDSSGHHFVPVWDQSFFSFRQKCPKCKTHVWNAEITKVIVRCLLLDWNHWMSVHATIFYFYLWLLKILWPEISSHISRHLEFIIEQGHRVNWVSGSLDSQVTRSLGHNMWPSSISGIHTFSTLKLLIGHQEEHTAWETLSDEVLVWLSVCREVQIVCIWSSDATADPKTP